MFPACCFHQRTFMAQELDNGYSMRLKLTLVNSLNDFQLVMVYMEVTPLFF